MERLFLIMMMIMMIVTNISCCLVSGGCGQLKGDSSTNSKTCFECPGIDRNAPSVQIYFLKTARDVLVGPGRLFPYAMGLRQYFSVQTWSCDGSWAGRQGCVCAQFTWNLLVDQVNSCGMGHFDGEVDDSLTLFMDTFP